MCDRERYMIKVDSTNATSGTSNSFVVYLPIPLLNVVKVEVLSASITPTSNSSPVLYLHAEELISKFLNRATVNYSFSANSNVLSSVGTLSASLTNESKLAEALVAVPVDTTRASASPVIYTTGGFFPTVVDYIDPIRQVSKLTINVYNSTGAQPAMSGPTYITFQFECAKKNARQY